MPLLMAVLAAVWFFLPGAAAADVEEISMKLVSDAFENMKEIPVEYTCQGEDVSPGLVWDDLPKSTKSLVLIVDDPDAPDPENPRMTWVHWVLYNIPPDAGKLPRAVAPDALPKGTMQGKNDWGRTGYGGPCPPIGRHRYFFKLYALDVILPDLNTPDKAAVVKAMEGHVRAHVELVGTYQKK